MKKKISGSAGVVLMLLFFTSSGLLFSQTEGTLSFSVTTTSTGGYTPEHLLAIWIENGSASFIKTKVRYSSNGNLDHLQTWVNKSGNNVVDAATGPTLTSHGTITFLWNGTNVAGTVVADGSYFVWLEMAWASSLTSGKTVNSFPFTKGTSAFHSTPANTTNFLSMALDWTPSGPTAVRGEMENEDIIVYPNPSSGLLNINFKNFEKECVVRIINETGQLVHLEKSSDIQAGIKTIDLTGLPAGIYYCTLRFPRKDLVFRIVLVR